MKKMYLAGASAGVLAAFGIAQTAAAADLPVVSPEPVIAPIASPLWTGFYVGGQLGYAFGGDVFEDDPFVASIDTNGDGIIDAADGSFAFTREDDEGFEAGIYVGADVQIDGFVLGVIGDLNYIDLDGQVRVVDNAGPTDVFTATADLDWYATLRGRAGYAIGNFLPYVHGGLAYSNVEIDGAYDHDDNPLTAAVAVSGDDDLWGYAVGAGVEALVMENVSVKAEYQYTNLGDSSVDNLFVDGSSSDVDLDFHTVRIGAAIRF